MAQRYEPLDWYSTPEWYDIIYDQDTAREVDFLERALDCHGRASRRPRASLRILEPACGSGRLLVEFARRGAAVAGFDLNEHMVAYSRDRLVAAGYAGRVERASLDRFDLGRGYDLVHCLVSTFKYLLDDIATREHFRAVARALRPGGLYVLGLHLTDYAVTRRQRERWVGRRDGHTVICNVQTWPPDKVARTEQVRSRLRVVEGQRERRGETLWTFRTYDRREILAVLTSIDASFELMGTYDFSYDLEVPQALDELEFDTVFVLRRLGR